MSTQLQKQQMAAQQQIKARAYQQALQQEIAAEVSKLCNETKFPASLIPERFKHWLGAALIYESNRTLECDWPILRRLRNADPADFSLTEMGFACNAIECKIPDQLPNFNYDEVQEEIFALCKKWNDIVGIIKTEVNEKYNKAASKIIVPSKPKIITH